MHALCTYCSAVSNDFEIENATIPPGENCTAITTRQDTIYERNEVFNVTLRPMISRDPEAEENESQSSISVSYTMILEDDESKCTYGGFRIVY